MTTDFERQKAANDWNYMWIDFLIDYMKKVNSNLELFEHLGKEASDMIDAHIEDLESIKIKYKMNG